MCLRETLAETRSETLESRDPDLPHLLRASASPVPRKARPIVGLWPPPVAGAVALLEAAAQGINAQVQGSS